MVYTDYNSYLHKNNKILHIHVINLTCVTGSFIIRTSVTGPNMAKYSLSFSELVCQLRPPTKSLLGDGEELGGAGAVLVAVTGVERPDDGEVSVGK